MEVCRSDPPDCASPAPTLIDPSSGTEEESEGVVHDTYIDTYVDTLIVTAENDTPMVGGNGAVTNGSAGILCGLLISLLDRDFLAVHVAHVRRFRFEIFQMRG